MLVLNMAYVLRRATLHRSMSIRDVVRVHVARDGMSWPLYAACIGSWQCFG